MTEYIRVPIPVPHAPRTIMEHIITGVLDAQAKRVQVAIAARRAVMGGLPR